MALNQQTKELLQKVSTATLCTALFKRGLRNQFIQGVVPVSPKTEVMVGQAFTLRYIPAREDRNPITVFRNADHPQRVAIETCPPGQVLVMDARKDARAATAGSILITRLALRGAAGVVHGDDVGRLDLAQEAALLEEPLADVEVARPVVGEHLDRDRRVEVLVVGEPHGREGSRTDATAHRITTETRGSGHPGIIVQA